MVGKTTVGFCFTLTVCCEVVLPQGLLTVSVTVYVPGLVNVKEGVSEFASVPFANDQDELVPQKLAA